MGFCGHMVYSNFVNLRLSSGDLKMRQIFWNARWENFGVCGLEIDGKRLLVMRWDRKLRF
jgi:hypothetical protein